MLKDTQFRSEEIKEIITKMPNKLLRYGNLLFLGMLTLFLMLAWLIKYPDIIKSSAILTTTIPVQKEYSKITAKIQAILINENDLVISNQPLLVLENTANFEHVFILQKSIESIDMQHIDLNSNLLGSSNYNLGDIKTAYNLFETNLKQYQLYQSLQPFDNEQLANQQLVHELTKQLKELQLQKGISDNELKLNKTQLNRSQSLYDRGVISALEHEQQQLQYSSSQKSIKSLNISESRLITSIHNAQKSSKVVLIDKTKEEFILYNRALQSLQKLEKSIQEWDLRYVLRSKIKGEVSFHDFWAIHQTVNQGDLVFTIIPTESSKFVARLETPIYNSGKIKTGQKVNLNLLDYPDVEFGHLVGKVQYVSSAPNQNGNYLVKVDLPQTLITTYNTEIIFRQEMRADAEIITENSRLLEKVFYQFKPLFER